MKKIRLTFWLILITTICLFSQNSKRTNIWYFGSNAGIDFNTNPPSFLLDGELDTWEGCATLCDTSGLLMIYTDGSTIWNSNHQIMPNATGLGGDNSASQSGIIVPAPESENQLYVFSVDNDSGSGGFSYGFSRYIFCKKIGWDFCKREIVPSLTKLPFHHPTIA